MLSAQMKSEKNNPLLQFCINVFVWDDNELEYRGKRIDCFPESINSKAMSV
jgi:hypothetical protein